MSADIGPGDFVEAVRDYSGLGASISRGAVYVVARVCVGEHGACPDCGDDGDSLDIEGQTLAGGYGWCFCDFRPIYRPKADAFTDLLKVPDRKRVTA
jgi:hypothetical protein